MLSLSPSWTIFFLNAHCVTRDNLKNKDESKNDDKLKNEGKPKIEEDLKTEVNPNKTSIIKWPLKIELTSNMTKTYEENLQNSNNLQKSENLKN